MKVIRTKEHNEKIGASNKARGVGASLEKKCPACKEVQPRQNFRRRHNGHSHSYCLPCERRINREKAKRFWDAHPELGPKRKAANFKTCLKRYFGITPEDYHRMLEDQQGRCAICNTHHSELRRRLAVDHCHETNEIRGLLCDPCNMGIGHFKDNPSILKGAIKYLTKKTPKP